MVNYDYIGSIGDAGFLVKRYVKKLYMVKTASLYVQSKRLRRKEGLRGGIPARSASRPAGRRANPPKADIVGNSTSVEWGRSGVKSDLGF